MNRLIRTDTVCQGLNRMSETEITESKRIYICIMFNLASYCICDLFSYKGYWVLVSFYKGDNFCDVLLEFLTRMPY